MSRRSELQAKLAQMRAIKQSGAKSTVVDGVSIVWDHKVIDQEIAKLEAELTGKRRRPRVMNIRLNG